MRLSRAAIGFCLGWVWTSVLSLLFVGALTAGYGGLDAGLARFKDEWWAALGVAACFSSITGSWTGATVGPMALERSVIRRPVIVSSLVGGVAGALLSGLVGALVGWLVWQLSPRSELVIKIPLYLGLPLGALCGWFAGRMISHGPVEPVA